MNTDSRFLPYLAITVALAFLVQPSLPAQGTPVQDLPAKPPLNIYAMKPSDRGNFTQQKTENTILALRQVEAHLGKLPKPELARLRRQARTAITDCPYTHATFVLIAAVHETTRKFPATVTGSGPAAKRQHHLALTRQVMDRLWRICGQLDVPAVLAGIDKAPLLRGAKPILSPWAAANGELPGLTEAGRLLSTIRKRVDALPKATKDRLAAISQDLQTATAGIWSFKGVLIRCTADLGTAIEPATKSPETKEPAEVRAARGILDVMWRHFVLYC